MGMLLANEHSIVSLADVDDEKQLGDRIGSLTDTETTKLQCGNSSIETERDSAITGEDHSVELSDTEAYEKHRNAK